MWDVWKEKSLYCLVKRFGYSGQFFFKKKTVSNKELLDTQATIGCGFTLKCVPDMIRTYSLRCKFQFLRKLPFQFWLRVCIRNKCWNKTHKQNIKYMVIYVNFEPSFKLRWCRAWDLFGSQIPVITGGFELQISCIRSSVEPP